MQQRALTFHLFDTSQRIFQRVDGAGLALAPLFRWQVHLELLQGLEELLLCLSFGGLFTAAGRTWDIYTCIRGMTRSHQRRHILVSTALQACRAEQKVGVYNRKVYRGPRMRTFIVREWALCCILTYSRWSKGCPVPSSPGWRRWSCSVARGYGSWSCSRKNKHAMSMKMYRETAKHSIKTGQSELTNKLNKKT